MDEYILITGASGNIGREVAKSLSGKHSLILCGTNKEKLEDTRRLCGDRKHIIWLCDLSKTEHIAENLGHLIVDNDIGISGFVHSAGIAPLVPLHMMTVDEMKKVMDVNFFSAVEISKILTKKKINAKHLCNVVFISSIASLMGTKGMTVYSASKGALDAFARSLAYELAPHVRVNTVLPGGMLANSDGQSDFGQDSEQGYLLGFGHTNDISSMVSFLLSNDSRWITGQHFVVDGGRISHY